MRDNLNIKCDVKSCKFCDCENNYCIRKEIKVCNQSKDCTKQATMCDSYKPKKD